MLNWLTSLFMPEGQTPQQFISSAIRDGLDQEFGISQRVAVARDWIGDIAKSFLNMALNFALDFFPSEAEQRIDQSLEHLARERDAAPDGSEQEAVLTTAYESALNASNGGVDRLMSRFGGEPMPLQVGMAVYNQEFERRAEAVMQEVYATAAQPPHSLDADGIANMRARFNRYIGNNRNWPGFEEAYPGLYREIVESAQRVSGLERVADADGEGYSFNVIGGGVYAAVLAGNAPNFPADSFEPVEESVLNDTLSTLSNQIQADIAIDASTTLLSALSDDEKTALADAMAEDFLSTADSAADDSITKSELDAIGSMLTATQRQHIGGLIRLSLGPEGSSRNTLSDIDIEYDSTGNAIVSVTPTIVDSNGRVVDNRSISIS